jgi:hypothetical protein
MKMQTASKAGMLAYLRTRFPQYDFGIRGSADLPRKLVPPANLWERIKQVFTGPVWRDQLGVVEIAVMTPSLLEWNGSNTAFMIHKEMEEVKPITVKIRLIAYEKHDEVYIDASTLNRALNMWGPLSTK